MTTIDGDRLPGSIPGVPGATLTTLEAESVRTGRSRGELVALAVDAMFSTAAAPSPAGAVDGGQGATRPPAPTDAPKVLMVAPAGFICITTSCWEEGRPAAWCQPQGVNACCDDHIPDGWALPEVVSPAPTVDTIATPMPHVHLGPSACVYGDRCGR